jgi:hypothetical protein
MLDWIKCADALPPVFEDVVIWSSDLPVVAYLNSAYFFDDGSGFPIPVHDVVAWAKINKPEF